MTPRKPLPASVGKTALLVHPDMTTLSGLQAELTGKGYTTIVARDLPTSLLAITQHYFDLALVSSQITEEGDGWPLASILRMVFQQAFVGVIAPGTDVLTLKTAINSGVDEIYRRDQSAQEIVAGLAAKTAASPRSSRSVQ
jgi:ActR/RegA family two-component response regulator